MNEYLVSILIPVYNREKFIEQTVKSAISQTYKNIEIIIVDNKSTDKTWDLLKELVSQDKRIKIFQNETNIGPVKNWQKCINYAKGEYSKILWSDDLISNDFIEKTISFIKNKKVGFVFTKTVIFWEELNKTSSAYSIGKTGIYKSDNYINGVLFGYDYPVSPGCALFRTEDLKKNLYINIPNKCNSDFSMHAIGNDLLIFLLTANKYKYYAFVNEKLSFFRAHENSITIQSNIGTLKLYYNLAATYFVENYKKDLINIFIFKLLLDIKRYNNEAEKLNLNKIENYFFKKIEKNYLYFLIAILNIIKNKIHYYIRKLKYY